MEQFEIFNSKYILTSKINQKSINHYTCSLINIPKNIVIYSNMNYYYDDLNRSNLFMKILIMERH